MQPAPLRQPVPSEAAIARVQRELGLDRIQAINHLRCRALLAQAPQRDRFKM